MINIPNFVRYQETIGYLAKQLEFPEKLTLHPKTFKDVVDEDNLAYPDLVKFREEVHQLTLLEFKQLYSDTFDFNKKRHCT